MLRSFLVAPALLLALTAPASAQSVYVLDRSSSEVTFRAHALATNLTGRSEQLRGLIRLQGVDLRRLDGSVSFPVSSLRMGSPSRDRELARLLGSPTEPEVIFEIDSIAPDTLAGRSWHFHGRLIMRGMARDVLFVGVARAVGARVHANGAATVDVREWGITPPSRFLGLIKMSPRVRLSFDAEFARQPAIIARDVVDGRDGACEARVRTC